MAEFLNSPGLDNEAERILVWRDNGYMGYRNMPSLENIVEWSAGSYSENVFVYKTINGQTYLFRSTADANTTEPLLNSQKEAWSPYFLGGAYIGVWSSLTAYAADNVVDREGYLYYCITGNTNSDPKTLTAPNWFKIGPYQREFTTANTYANGDAVTDESDAVYLSNYDNNDYLLDNGIVSKWELVNGQPNTIVAWGTSITYGTGSTGNSNYPSELHISSGINVDNQGVPGETSTQILTRFLAAPDKWVFPTILEMCRNNYTDPTTVKADIATAVTKLQHGRYLVIGPIRANGESVGPIEALSLELEAIYGDRYIDLQSYLLSIYNLSIPQDVADHAAGKIAWSLHSDWLHLNNNGYFYVAKIINSRLGYLLGADNLKRTNIEATSLQVTGNVSSLQNTEGLEFLYDTVTGKGVIQAYDRKTGTVKDVSIGFTTGGKVYINENGGDTYIGELAPYSSGQATRIVRDTTTGQLLESPSIGTGVVPYQDANGVFQASNGYYNGTVFGIGTGSNIEAGGGIAQIAGSMAVGAANGDTRLYIFQLDADTVGIQSRALVAKFLKFFVAGVEFDSEVKVSTATDPTSAIQLQQAEALVESMFTENLTPTPFTAGTLNSTYPSAPVGFRVLCPHVATGTIYTKTSAGWIVLSGTIA